MPLNVARSIPMWCCCPTYTASGTSKDQLQSFHAWRPQRSRSGAPTPCNTSNKQDLRLRQEGCDFITRRMRTGNRLLDSIPDSEFKIIRPYLRKAALKKKTASVEDGDGSGRVYFPTAGLVSYIVSTSRGEQLEIYAAGWRDVIGLAASGQPWQAKVQIEGNAMTVSRSELFACLKRMHAFSDVLLNYLAELTARAGQRVCCAHFHTASSRVCSWLAVAMDTTGRVGLECTQQSIADAIGSRRATVTVVLGDLEKQNLIRC